MPDHSDDIITAVSASDNPNRAEHGVTYPQGVPASTPEAQQLFNQLVQASLADLTQRRQRLEREVEQLEQRRDRLQTEMRTNFAGVSQDLAVRVQGFKDYLVGSLQDLAVAAEQLSLKVPESSTNSIPQRSPQPLNLPPSTKRRSGDIPSEQPQGQSTQGQSTQRQLPLQRRSSEPGSPSRQDQPVSPQGLNPQPRNNEAITAVAHQMFGDNAKQIRQILNQYRQTPDYYGAPWQLRRTFEPIHADRVSQWFFEHGGRGSLKTLGSRLQNVLVASAIISVLRAMHGDRLHTLILSDSPERLGEWRRGLQDCLGISRSDFGGQQGVALFEAPEAVTQRAERLRQQSRLPLILIDNSEDKVHLSLLQYPLWLAFAPDLNTMPLY